MMKQNKIPEWMIKFEELCKKADDEISKEKKKIIQEALQRRLNI